MQGAPPAFMTMQSFRRDRDVVQHKLTPGTWRRIVAFASPYKRPLFWFLVVIVIAAAATAANPLIFKKIIDDGIGTDPPASGNQGLVIGLAILALDRILKRGQARPK